MGTVASGLKSPALPPVMRVPLAVVNALSALAFGFLALHYAGTGSSGRVDRWALDAMGGTLYTPSPARTLALLIDRCGELDGAVVVIVLLIAACLAAGKGRLAILAALGPACAVAACRVLKPIVGRTVPTGSFAFPSGHTAFLTSVGLVVGLLIVGALDLKRHSGVLVAGACVAVAGAAMSWSQTVLFEHYPTDTLGGFLLALAVIPAIAVALDLPAIRRNHDVIGT